MCHSEESFVPQTGRIQCQTSGQDVYLKRPRQRRRRVSGAIPLITFMLKLEMWWDGVKLAIYHFPISCCGVGVKMDHVIFSGFVIRVLVYSEHRVRQHQPQQPQKALRNSSSN